MQPRVVGSELVQVADGLFVVVAIVDRDLWMAGRETRHVVNDFAPPPVIDWLRGSAQHADRVNRRFARLLGKLQGQGGVELHRLARDFSLCGCCGHDPTSTVAGQLGMNDRGTPFSLAYSMASAI